MSRYLLRRFAQMAGVFFVFLTLLFTLLHAMPGDITNNLIGNPNIPASAREQLRQELGLDLPLWQQYLRYITNFRSEEHTSELQSRENLVCRLLLEKKKQ